ncbi:hypothetical protein ACWDOP_00390 [Nocardia sp. NPDC003693]
MFKRRLIDPHPPLPQPAGTEPNPATPPPPVPHGAGVSWQGTVLVLAGLVFIWLQILHGFSPWDATRHGVLTIGALVILVMPASMPGALVREIGRRLGTPRPGDEQ